ncbi:hypothetical protein [Tepidibacter aestuarii]|uniref:hypothetical protein n=1 Tax=Tepidibacter aestuarii TaxID=2925782 RepID=UPI0020BF60F5|nr:hypothetical protein [Tepidibacter aestuarii]CAH2213683.1 conserved protein of unknown function [Tepidibacter aestuarii]
MNKLSRLLKYNKHISIKIDPSEKKLNIFDKTEIIKSTYFPFNDLNEHIDYVYNIIISINNVNLYIPKIYTKD